MLLVARGLRALVAEHSLALGAATTAHSTRRRLTELRAMYTAPTAKRGTTVAKDNYVRSRAMARRLATGFNMVALVVALGLIALLAA